MNLDDSLQVKEASHRRLRVGDSTCVKRAELACPWRWGESGGAVARGVTASGHSISAWGNENVLEPRRGHGRTLE